MEATTLTRSVSLAARLRRSHTVKAPPHMSTLSPALRALPLRRARSDADLAGSVPASRSSASLLRSPRILEEADEAPMDECFHGAGVGGKGNSSSGRGGSGGGGQSGMGEYYRRVLRLEPENPLLLRNYGKYLHEVEGDLTGAEEYYGRALLACPGDADLLSLYGRVLWEAHQEKERAAAYFERAVQAAPDDCHVLGSYASFLWDAEEDQVDDEERARPEESTVVASPAC